MTDPILSARDAVSDKRWRDAYVAYGSSDLEDLAPDDLRQFALAAQLVGEDEVAAATWERAHLKHLADGDIAEAVNCAFWLAFGLLNAGRMPQAGGWFGRAQRLVDEHEIDTVERGFLLAPVGLRMLESGDPEGAIEVFDSMLAIGRRFGDTDLIALSHMAHGRARVIIGSVDEGVGLLDEAMVSVTAGEVSPMIAGRIYCAVVLVCHQAFDVERVRTWTEALGDWCDAQQDIVPFRGQCLIHRSEVKQWQGDWSGALTEAMRAQTHLADPPGQPAIGMAFYQLGDLNRLRGNFGDATAAYQEASAHGKPPIPGTALLHHARGNIDAAAADIRRALDTPTDRRTRAAVLSAAVEILAAAGDVDDATLAAAELEAIAGEVGADQLRAMAMRAKATVSLAAGDHREALAAAQQAAGAWARLESPYDHARARVTAAEACLALEDEDAARFWLDTARTTFEELGAEPDVERCLALVSADDDDGPLTERQQQVLAAVASGKTNAEIADELFVSEHTVRRHLQNIYTAIGVNSRSAATAYAYEHGLL